MGKSSLKSKASPLASDWITRPHQYTLWKCFTVHSVSVLGPMILFSMKGGCRPRISWAQLYLRTQPRLATSTEQKCGSSGFFPRHQIRTLKEVSFTIYCQQERKLLPSSSPNHFFSALKCHSQDLWKTTSHGCSAFQKPPHSKHVKLGNWWEARPASLGIGRLHTGQEKYPWSGLSTEAPTLPVLLSETHVALHCRESPKDHSFSVLPPQAPNQDWGLDA